MYVPTRFKKKFKKTKAVIYTQMNGRNGQIKEILKICKKNNVYLIEELLMQ